jgi:hypothetical protein
MESHLVRWHKEYTEQGLVILDINNGEYDKMERVRKHVEKKKIPYAVLHDAGEKNCNNYGIKAYPSSFLIGVDGKVIWEGYALKKGKLKEIEKLIREELKKVEKEKD